MAKSLVVKDNALINASYNLELVEQRLILLSIIEARTSGKGINPNDCLTITASSYMNNFATSRNAAYKALKEACDNLFDRQFSYIETNARGNVEIVRSRWVSEIRYVENEASVKLIFSPAVSPLITLLEKNFTSYELEQISELNSKYSVRLYEVIIAWRVNGKTPMLSVEELRQRLGVLGTEYTVMADFKRWVLDKPIAQINKKTDIAISYEQHKQGRKIIGFTFIIKQKRIVLDKPTKPKKSPVPANGIEHLQQGLSDEECQAIQEQIDEYIQRLEAKGEIVSDFYRQNIVNKAFSEHWGLDVLAARQEQKQKKQEQMKKAKAEKLAKEQIAREQSEREERRMQEMMFKFENLSLNQQKYILNQVEKQIPPAFMDIFQRERRKNIVHKNQIFKIHFYDVFGI